ncbi:MAG: alpha-amylase family glycosyl hydrolase [Proteobacteria bacterium]|nr:alpha-amylase family glycosyl hydrolase [Pseudomonadota bacterium]
MQKFYSHARFKSLILLGFIFNFGRPLQALEGPSQVRPSTSLIPQSLQIESSEDFPIAVDKQQRLRALSVNADGLKFAYEGRVRWSRSNDNLAIADNGLVTGLKPGKTIVTVESLDQPGLSQSLELEIRKEPIYVYFQAPKNWQKAHVWSWYLDGNADITGLDPKGNPLAAISTSPDLSYPGPAMKAVDGMPGWFFIALPRWDDESLFPGRKLLKQPIRVVFSNPDNGEKTRDFAHYDGCFLSYNRYLRGNIIDGRWDSPMNCPAFPKRLRVIAEPRGGPVWGAGGFVDLSSSGAKSPITRFTVDGTAASLDRGQSFPPKALNLDQLFNSQGQAVVCAFAKNAVNAGTTEECFHFDKTDSNAFRNFSGLGVRYTENSSTFAIWSPDRSSVELWLDGQTIPMGYIGNQINMPGVWAVTVPGNHYLKRYQYFIDDNAVRDPYSVMVEAGTDYSIVLDPSRISPKDGWVSTPRLTNREDAIIYEMSVRDFTSDPNSGVSAENRGKFSGLVEANTWFNKGQAGENPSIRTGLEHLKELGVTHVQLMPVFDYATCSKKDVRNGPGCYNWGYDPENFNVPEELYSKTPTDPINRVQEFQTMVNEFHKAGLRVVIDVVYNHTWTRPYREADEGEKYFGDITGKYFLFDKDGIGYQLTGTGNTIDPKDPMVNMYIRDSLEYWVKTYNVDGFRFDVAGVFDTQEITGWMTYLYEKFPQKQLLAYGEPYTALPDPDPNHFRLNNVQNMQTFDGKRAEFGGFNFSFREAIKGNNDTGLGGGFVFNDSYDVVTLMNGLRGSLGNGNVNQSAFADDPVQTINYASSHDNLNLFDKINAWASLQNFAVSQDYKMRIQAFANSIILVSQGMPFLHSGEEFARSKSGVPDSYQAGDAVNRVNWNKKLENFGLFEFSKQLVNLRRKLAGLRLPSKLEIDQAVSVKVLSNGVIELKISPNGKNRQEILVLLNSGQDKNYDLPSGDWTLALEQGKATQERRVSGQVNASGTAITLLYR